MFPFLVDKKWFENYWYDTQVRSKRQASAMRLARFAVCIVLVVGSVAVVSHLRSGERTGNAHINRTGSMME